MAIILADRYPGRAGGKTLDYPQGSFKNRTSPTAKDGTYLEQDWANDMLAFFQALMSDAGMTASGTVDTARASQYFDALVKTIKGKAIPGATFAEVDALTADQGPIIVTDMDGAVWKWTASAYFTGYRNPRCGDIPQSFAPTPRAWEMAVTGGVWSESDPKQRRLIALFRERGHVVTAGAWLKGWGRIADLGGGDWKAPDLQDVFLRMAGTDADTANAAGPGCYQADAMQRLTGSAQWASYGIVHGTAGTVDGVFGRGPTALQDFAGSGTASTSRPLTFDSARVARTSSETRVAGPRVLPVVLI